MLPWRLSRTTCSAGGYSGQPSARPSVYDPTLGVPIEGPNQFTRDLQDDGYLFVGSPGTANATMEPGNTPAGADGYAYAAVLPTDPSLPIFWDGGAARTPWKPGMYYAL